MIAKMKKVQVLAMNSRRREVTEALAKLGTLHIETRDASSPDLNVFKEQGALLTRAFLAIPENSKAGYEALPVENLDQALAIAGTVVVKETAVKDAADRLDKLTREISRVQDWGDFDPSEVAGLDDSGVKLWFAYATKDQLTRIPEDMRFLMVQQSKDKSRIIFLDEPAGLDVELFRLPASSLSELIEEAENLREKHEALKSELEGMQAERHAIARGQEIFQRLHKFAAVEASLEEVEDLDIICEIEGFLPAARVDELKDFAADAGVALVIKDPEPDEAVPTKVENPRAISIIAPVFQFMGTTPGYRELDISFWFLIFFTVFFAMIIGDAGYGAFLTVVSFFLTIRSKVKTGKVHDGLILFNILSLATVVWGAITGNWFGYGPIAQIPFLHQFVIPSLDSFNEAHASAVTQLVELICFTIALIHLVLAHTLAFLKKVREAPRIHAIADLGWLAAIVGLYFLVRNVVLGAESYPVPGWAIPVIGGGIGLVFLFSGQEGDGFFKGVLRALGDLINIALGGVSAFADIISYIRLFAVGLAGISIAKAFNAMAIGMMDSGPAGLIGGIFVLAFGHSLNLVMGALSVMVHGIRLKMLEFSSHVGNEWTGFEYKPFKN